MSGKTLAGQTLERERIIRETPPHIIALIPKFIEAVEALQGCGLDPNEVLGKMIKKANEKGSKMVSK